MNGFLDNLEAELKQLAPQPPPERLRLKIMCDLEAAPPVRLLHSPRPIRTVCLALAAALALLLAGWHWFWPLAGQPSTAPGSAPSVQAAAAQPPTSPFQMVDQGRYLWRAEDEGIVYLPGQQPFRQVRCQFIDAAQWQNSRDHLSVNLATPVEEVVLLPISTY